MIWWFLGFQIHKNVILRDASLAVSFPGSFFSISAVKRSLPGELFYSRLFSSLKGFILECLLQVFCKTAQNLFAVFIPSFFYCSCEGQFDTMSYDTCLFLKNFTSTIKKQVFVYAITILVPFWTSTATFIPQCANTLSSFNCFYSHLCLLFMFSNRLFRINFNPCLLCQRRRQNLFLFLITKLTGLFLQKYN